MASKHSAARWTCSRSPTAACWFPTTTTVRSTGSATCTGKAGRCCINTPATRRSRRYPILCIRHRACGTPSSRLMNVDIIKVRWKQLGARLKTQWAKLSEDDVGLAEGHRDYLIGRLQERYGWARDRAEAEVARFESELSSADKER